LLSPFNLTRRSFVAAQVSSQLLQKWAGHVPTRPMVDQTATLHLGFSSHDISLHPTAQMLEGLVARLRNLPQHADMAVAAATTTTTTTTTITTTIYAYGKDDNSSVRARLKASVPCAEPIMAAHNVPTHNCR